MYRGFNIDMGYVDIKVAFEIVYVMLSPSQSLGKFQVLILEHLYVFPKNEPPWKWRGESHSHLTGGQRGKLRRTIINWKCVLILHIIRDVQVGKFLHQFFFKSNHCFTDRPTKVIGVIQMFKMFFEILDLFDVFASTFVELLLQRRDSIS